MTGLPRCRSCHAPILWARTVQGRNMPIDRDPSPYGNVVMSGRKVDNGNGVMVPEVRVEAGPALFGESTRYVSHFATCPSADQHRSKA